jgi:hypothetical protein
VWSNVTFVAETVRTPVARELAWQSTQEPGCGRPAVVKEAWKIAGAFPDGFVPHVAAMLAEGAR